LLSWESEIMAKQYRKNRRNVPAHRLEELETRQLMSATYPTAVEQYVVELINRARANPAAEAARDGIDLNEGLKAGTISSAAKQPLALNPYLTDAARGHSQWMIDHDTFSHTGANGSNPADRMKASGYPFVAPSAWSSNIALRSFKTAAPHNDVFEAIHDDQFVDLAIPDRGHRVNMLAGNMKEVGVGGAYGQYSYWTAEAITENFAASAGNSFLTGVVYTDTVTKDNFYTPGEGLGGVTLTVTRSSDGATFTTQTWAAGGYSIQLAPGTYKVAASGGGLKSPITYNAVTIGSQNVKRDFVPAGTAPTPQPPPTPTPPTPPPPPAAGAPAAPTNVVASPVSSTSILITWTDNATNETAYKVERSTDGKTFYPVLGGGANSTRALDTKLSGRRYYYRVYAVNSAGKSAYGTVVNAVPGNGGTTPAPDPTPNPTPNPTPPPASGAPAAPTGLVATPVSATSILLTWTDRATNETAYKVERSTDGKTFYPVLGGGANATRALDTNLGTRRYYYRVYAMNAAGKSAYTAVASAVPSAGGTPNPTPTPTPTPPPATGGGTGSGGLAAPTNLTVRKSTSVARALELSWTDQSSNETLYKVERSTDGKTFYALAGTAGTFNRDGSVTTGKRYYYRVYAVNAAGKSAYSNVASRVV
jgi:uncharacterized protein YkwD/fibronectin type 3 domain-containing protein